MITINLFETKEHEKDLKIKYFAVAEMLWNMNKDKMSNDEVDELYDLLQGIEA